MLNEVGYFNGKKFSLHSINSSDAVVSIGTCVTGALFFGRLGQLGFFMKDYGGAYYSSVLAHHMQ